jgi:hypothetical protein
VIWALKCFAVSVKQMKIQRIRRRISGVIEKKTEIYIALNLLREKELLITIF